MFVHVGQWIARHWPWVIGAWLMLAVALHVVAPRWDQITHDGDLAYLPERMPSVQGEKLLRAAFPNQLSKSTVAIVLERSGGALEPEDLALVDRLADECESLAKTLPIVNVYTHRAKSWGTS